MSAHSDLYNRTVGWTRRWHLLKAVRVWIALGACENCRQVKPWYYLHHMTYERLGRERITDVRIICDDCHPEMDRQRKEREQSKWKSY